MAIHLVKEYFDGEVKELEAEVYRDDRGFFQESFRSDQLAAVGVNAEFKQDNHSGSVKNVLRGLHFQFEPALGKLMRVTRGAAFLVAVDIRKYSPTLGQSVGVLASAENAKMLWAPAYFARGFYSMSEFAEIQYKCTGIYNPKTERAIHWQDPLLQIDWPSEVTTSTPITSEKDANANSLESWLESPESDAFVYTQKRRAVVAG
ncbi:UNVERIFIED_CONTAM: hypothetical protein GTU68_002023 [Idotea baltica]|nr:hypothetical protein [Idotea baltica]